EAERLPVARAVLEQTGVSTQAVLSLNPALRLLRDHVLLRLLRLSFIQDKLAYDRSQLAVNYRSSPLAQAHEARLTQAALWPQPARQAPSVKDWIAFRAGPRAGDRAPQAACVHAATGAPASLFDLFRGIHWTLLLLGGLGHTAEGYARLAAIARQATTLLG